MSEAKKGVKLSDETRNKMSERQKGKVIPKEVIAKIVDTRKKNGYTHSEETRRKISEANKGRVSPRKGKVLNLTDEQRRRIKEGQKGRVTTDETKQKLREIMTGRKLTEEQIKLVTEKRRQPVMTPNGEFESRQALINRLISDGVHNPTDKLRAWFKLYPNNFFYIKKMKAGSVKTDKSKFDPVSTLNETAKRLLDTIISCHLKGEPLTVLNAMSLKNIASEITIHRKLAHMLELGLIVKEFKGNDFRRKYLIPTKLSIEHLKSK